MTRKIVQIAVTSAPNESDILYALCEDGTLWSVQAGHMDWVEQLPPPSKPVKVGSHVFTKYGSGHD